MTSLKGYSKLNKTVLRRYVDGGLAAVEKEKFNFQ